MRHLLILRNLVMKLQQRWLIIIYLVKRESLQNKRQMSRQSNLRNKFSHSKMMKLNLPILIKFKQELMKLSKSIRGINKTISMTGEPRSLKILLISVLLLTIKERPMKNMVLILHPNLQREYPIKPTKRIMNISQKKSVVTLLVELIKILAQVLSKDLTPNNISNITKTNSLILTLLKQFQ